MFKLWATIKKDTRILLRDKVGIALMFVMPVILVIVVTSIQNSTFQLVDKNKLPILICNRDTGNSSKELITAIDKIGMFKVSQIAKNETEKKIADAMQNSDAMLSIAIPSNFSAQVMANSKNAAGKAMNSFGLQGDTVKTTATGLNPLTIYYNPILQQSIQLSVKGALLSALQMVESRETLRTLYFSINEKPLPQKLEDEMLRNHAKILSLEKIISDLKRENNQLKNIYARRSQESQLH